MKIPNETALASHVARALEAYANQVQNGLELKPWKPFLEGAEYVDLRITLVSGGMFVEQIPPIMQEITLPQVVEPVLVSETLVTKEPMPTPEIVVEEKPKRKRKTAE